MEQEKHFPKEYAERLEKEVERIEGTEEKRGEIEEAAQQLEREDSGLPSPESFPEGSQEKILLSWVEDPRAKKQLAVLFAIAQEKGVAHAVAVVRKINDPYLLDKFHDLLARERLFENYPL